MSAPTELRVVWSPAHPDHFRPGRGAVSITGVVWHKTDSDNQQGTAGWFALSVEARTRALRESAMRAAAQKGVVLSAAQIEAIRGFRSSAHLSVDLDGDPILQHVQFDAVAFHAGNANPFTIGVEVVGRPNTVVSERQYAACASIARFLQKYFAIPLRLGRPGGHSGHKEWMKTACPANLDVARIIREAKRESS